MTPHPTYSSFQGHTHIVTGTLTDMLHRTQRYAEQPGGAPLLIFEDHTGRQLDFDFRGDIKAILAREVPPAPRAGPGRPKLGVVSREVSLLPRHWDWLEQQRGGASATLRRLIDEARRHDAGPERERQRQEAAGRVMTALAGDLPGYEEASRALYAGRTDLLAEHTAAWPPDVRAYVLRLAAGESRPA
ncbi:DUF2239 family protein [Deinococcus sonorensis]|uniref:DUF2239 family protein n=2 Tax=Deinococcus sonorensis TaxID=309891 RepID=A0AAU7U8I8_9DEIO